jgi:hypothetical protein
LNGALVHFPILHDQREVLFRIVEEREILRGVAVDQENVGQRAFATYSGVNISFVIATFTGCVTLAPSTFSASSITFSSNIFYNI